MTPHHGFVRSIAIAAACTVGLVFGVGAADPATFSGVPVLMATVALFACAIPALRAMRVQPAVVLRND